MPDTTALRHDGVDVVKEGRRFRAWCRLCSWYSLSWRREDQAEDQASAHHGRRHRPSAAERPLGGV